MLTQAAMADALRAIDKSGPKPMEQLGGVLDTHPSLDARLAALVPLEPAQPVANAEGSR